MELDHILIVAFVALSFALVYLFVVRPVLVNAPKLSPAFAKEAAVADKVRAKITGFKTKIASRLVVIGGVLVGLYDQALPFISAQDWTPITAKLPSWSLPVGLVFLGLAFSWLRRATENPPQIITQKTEDGVPQVVAVVKPPV